MILIRIRIQNLFVDQVQDADKRTEYRCLRSSKADSVITALYGVEALLRRQDISFCRSKW